MGIPRSGLDASRRDALSPQAKAEMDALCRANDYDEKFRQALGILDEIVQPDRITTTHNLSLVAELRKELCPLQSLRTSYREDRQNLVNEIERLQKVWREQNEWYNEQIRNVQEVLQSEIHRLKTAHGEAIQQRDETRQQRDTEIARLAAEIHYYRRFRIAAKRIPGQRPSFNHCRGGEAGTFGGLRDRQVTTRRRNDNDIRRLRPHSQSACP